MMVFEQELKAAIQSTFQQVFGQSLEQEKIAIQPTRKDFEGTHTFVLFPFLKQTRKSPELSGQMLGDALKEAGVIAAYNVVKGFLNLSFPRKKWLELFEQITQDDHFGNHALNGKKVMVEFSSPNTNKPLHLGHLRNNIFQPCDLL
jgi:arginyl-tRNA synthetase